MDACARLQGVPLRTRVSIRKETVRDSGTQCLKTLLRNKKELCNVGQELQTRDAHRLTEMNFLYLPGYSEGEDLTLQALSSLPGDLAELLRSLHVTSLRNEEVLLLKDSRRLTDRRDSATQQCWLKAVCVLRHSFSPSQAIVSMLVGLLGRYAAGVRYAMELQALHRGTAEPGQPEEDDTNQSVSSIEDDFVTALEHLEEEEHSNSSSNLRRNQRDVASQTVPAHKRDKDLSGSRIIISSASRKSLINCRSPPEVSVTVQRPRGAESQWTLCSPRARLPSPTRTISESESSDCSSPSPIIFLDEVGYQKSLKAILDIPQIPGGPTDRVEDSDSEVSEFFDSFDQFDDFDELSSESCTLTLPLDQTSITTTGLGKKKHSEVMSSKSGSKKVSRSSSTMNPHRFDQRTLPANVKKPTPLRSPLHPRSPYGSPDSPRPTRNSCEESGGPLFSPVSSSAFSPLGDGGALDHFWKTESDGDDSELRKPQDLCSLYKTYSDFASSLSMEILSSVCGYQSPVDINDNKNLSCVCHKEFQNQSGYIMKLSEIQEAVTVSKMQQKPQSLKDGIQRFATDLVEMSLGSALRDLQKGVSSCTTTLCHLAARLTSSVFQMAFQEIGMRRACVLKERAINGLAGFLVGEAVSGALKDFLKVKKQMFNSTVTQFAADLAEELVFEGMMEVCQFSHPSTPITPSDWSFGVGEEDDDDDDDEEVVSSYASDLSESVIQEAFIELSQADVAFTTQAAISVSLDNICYVSADDTHTTCSTAASLQAFQVSPAEQSPDPTGEYGCTVKKALFCVSGMASCVPVPNAGQVISHLHNSEEICQCKSSLAHTSQTSPKRSCCSESSVVTTASFDTTAATQTDLLPKTPFQNFPGNMVDTIVSEACEITSTKMKKVEDYADFLSKTLVGPRPQSGQKGSVTDQTSMSSLHSASQTLGGVASEAGSRMSCAVPETRPGMMKDTLEVPGSEMGGREGRKLATGEEMVTSPGCKSNGTPGTPPSTPQQPSVVSQEKRIKQFSKKLKGKLAKEFSPATPPPTPHYLPEPELIDSPSEKDKADFMLKLMRSLSEEADGNEEEEEEEGGVEGGNSKSKTEPCLRSEPNLSVGGHKLTDKGALRYAERLACHIISLATEMDTLGVADGGRRVEERRDSVARFSEQTLNTLWIYAGEVAGEVISDVKKMMGPGRCRHRGVQQGSLEKAGKCPHLQHHTQPSEHSRDCRVGHLADRRSCNAPHLSTTSSGMSSEYPSCESVTDEYAGYLIRVLKKEGGSRELILDQYASRLAYRSIKLGLAHAARNVKKSPSSSRHHSSRRHHNYSFRGPNVGVSIPRDEAGGVGSLSSDSDDGGQQEYTELVHFAESLAYNVTCDVTRKLRMSSARLPKSLTDSCLYQKSKLEDMAENLVRNSFSCPLLAREGRSRQYHSTGSLYNGDHSNGVMQVIEHYARKIVDDTLKMGLASAGHPTQQAPERHSHSERLTEGGVLGSVQGETACRYCQVRECLFCMQPSRSHLLGAGQRRRRRADGEVGACGLEIPEIHIDLDRRAVLADALVTTAMEGAKREPSNTSLNADSGIGHDGPSFAESLTAEIMVSALSNACQTAHLSSPGGEASEATVSHQLSLSVGDDSLGSWSNLSFEDEHPDETSSFLHLSDSNGNSSSWSSLGLEGEVYDEHLSFSHSDSDCTEDKDSETKDESCVRADRGQGHRLLLVVNSELRETTTDPRHMAYDPQLRSMLQWVAASMADLAVVQLGPSGSRELQQLPAVVQRLKEREWRVGDLLQALLRFCEETQTHTPPQAEPREDASLTGRAPQHMPLFQWLLERA